jgi:hypothetical protein
MEGSPHQLNSIIHSNTKYVAAGILGHISTSIDGIRWQRHSTGVQESLMEVNSLNGNYVAVGTHLILTSTDAISWSPYWLIDNSTVLYSVTYGQGIYVTVGTEGHILTSSDLIKWLPQNSETRQHLRSICYHQGLYVAVGMQGIILTSRDAIHWTKQNSNTNNHLYHVTYQQNQYIAVGETGTILTSSNGLNWTLEKSPTTEILRAVHYGNYADKDTHIVVGDNGILLTSSDTLTWTLHPSVGAVNLLGLA